jgi:hypothetical protein
MKKVIGIAIALILTLSLVPAIALADEPATQSGDGPLATIAAAMPLDGTWIILDEYMSEGDYFTGNWDWTSTVVVKFTITDLYVVTDEFEVYDGGSLVLTTPSLPDYSELGIGAYDEPPWTDDPDVALTTKEFSKGVVYFAPGSHSIEIRDIDIPSGFQDGTVAFKAEEVQLAAVDKHWSYTNVCFQQDNDGDGKYDEDPIDFDPDTGKPIDNDGDGLYNEDPVECDGDYSLGTPLPEIDEDVYALEATVKNDKIMNINPGQFYAVSLVKVYEPLDKLLIYEKYGNVLDSGIGALNPKNGGGRVVVVQIMPDGTPRQILDAKDDAVEFIGKAAHVTLEDVSAESAYLVYVKFGPTLKGKKMDEYSAVNHNCYVAEVDGAGESDCAKAMIVVVPK